MKPIVRWIAVLGCLFCSLLGPGTAMAQKSGGVLKIYHRDSPASMSILEEGTNSTEIPMMGVFNNLVMYDQHVAQNSLSTIVPDLATDWSTSEDGTQLTFHLRKGVKWQDGVLHGDIREDLSISQEIVELIQDHGALSVVMIDGIIGCPIRKESITRGNGALFASFGVDAIALRDRCLLKQDGVRTDCPCENTSTEERAILTAVPGARISIGKPRFLTHGRVSCRESCTAAVDKGLRPDPAASQGGGGMAPILTPEDVVRRIAAECTYVDERGAVGIRLEPAAAIVRQYGEQFRAPRRQRRPRSPRPASLL